MFVIVIVKLVVSLLLLFLPCVLGLIQAVCFLQRSSKSTTRNMHHPMLTLPSPKTLNTLPLTATHNLSQPLTTTALKNNRHTCMQGSSQEGEGDGVDEEDDEENGNTLRHAASVEEQQLKCIVLYCMYCIVLYCVLLYCTVCIVLYFIVLYCMYCIVLCFIVLYCLYCNVL